MIFTLKCNELNNKRPAIYTFAEQLSIYAPSPLPPFPVSPPPPPTHRMQRGAWPRIHFSRLTGTLAMNVKARICYMG